MMPLKDIAANLPKPAKRLVQPGSFSNPLYWYITLAVGALGMAVGFWLGS